MAAHAQYVRAVVKAFLGNGYGVCDAAIPSYTRMLVALDPRQAGRALRAFTDPAISSVLWLSTADSALAGSRPHATGPTGADYNLSALFADPEATDRSPRRLRL